MSEEIKTCPFCGEAEADRNSDRWGHFYVCNCGARAAYGSTPADALQAWNHRGTLAQGATTNEVLPCPFCGAAPAVDEHCEHHRIWCENIDCDVTVETAAGTVEMAKLAWNKRQAAPLAERGSDKLPATQEYFLRAMATNYAGGHCWDHLDGQTCVMAADEIAALRAALERSSPAEKASVSIRKMDLSDGRADYYVLIKVGDREVTPHVFREEYKAAYHVTLYDWLLNGTGEEPNCIEFGPNDWPARVHSQPGMVTIGDKSIPRTDLEDAIAAWRDHKSAPTRTENSAQRPPLPPSRTGIVRPTN